MTDQITLEKALELIEFKPDGVGRFTEFRFKVA